MDHDEHHANFQDDSHDEYEVLLPPDEVRRRIESLVLDFLRELVRPEGPNVMPLSLLARRSITNWKPNADTVTTSQDNEGFSVQRPLTGLNGVRINSYIRDCHDLFPLQRFSNEAIQDVVCLLRCPRCSLGIQASSKGAIIGRVFVKEGVAGAWVDCSKLGSCGMSITGNIWIINSLQFSSDARYIIIVEKDAVFQRLAEDRIFASLPCILVTAKGFPDLATRVLLHRLTQLFPHITLLGLVDMNPAGLSILCTYKFGSIRMPVESPRYVCNVKWLGLRTDDIHLIPDCAIQPLTHRDKVMAKNMLDSPMFKEHPLFYCGLKSMLEKDVRADIEALYAHGYDFLSKFIIEKTVKQQYI